MNVLRLSGAEFSSVVAALDGALGYPDAVTKTVTYAQLPEPDANGRYVLPLVTVWSPDFTAETDATTLVPVEFAGRVEAL